MAITNDLNPSAPPFFPPCPGQITMYHLIPQPLKPRGFLPHQIFAYSGPVSVPQYAPQYLYYYPQHRNVAYYAEPEFFPSPEKLDSQAAVSGLNSPVEKPANEKASGKTKEKNFRQGNERTCSGSSMRWEKRKGPLFNSFPPRQVISPPDLCGRTTLMIKNIPNIFIRENLINILDQLCRNQNRKEKRKGDAYLAYDFLYLPIDFKSGCNLGYAFVNFTTSLGASKLRKIMDSRGWAGSDSKKICQISLARIQGKNELLRHFQNALFPCNSDDYLPAVFHPPRNGSFRITHMTIIGRRPITSHTRP